MLILTVFLPLFKIHELTCIFIFIFCFSRKDIFVWGEKMQMYLLIYSFCFSIH